MAVAVTYKAESQSGVAAPTLPESQNFVGSMQVEITNIEDAIYQTMEDRDDLACIIMDISPDANLDHFFRSLDNNQTGEMLLEKDKGRPRRRSWLRLYAIKLNVGIYIITGGAIKLTHTMQEREHTLQELERMEKVRNFLLREGVFDEDSFNDYQREVEP